MTTRVDVVGEMTKYYSYEAIVLLNMAREKAAKLATEAEETLCVIKEASEAPCFQEEHQTAVQMKLVEVKLQQLTDSVAEMRKELLKPLEGVIGVFSVLKL